MAFGILGQIELHNRPLDERERENATVLEIDQPTDEPGPPSCTPTAVIRKPRTCREERLSI